MPGSRQRLPLCCLIVAIAVACDSSGPGFHDPALRVEGEVLEEGQPPTPPLNVELLAWPALEPDGFHSANLETDASGSFAAELGPFAGNEVDSLLVRVTQHDCEQQISTDLRYGDLTLEEEVDLLQLPTIALYHRLPRPSYGPGAEWCGVIISPDRLDLMRLALWFDDISDSVRGRWRFNHTASFGDTYGYFSGIENPDGLSLQLRPTDPQCSVVQLDIPINSSGEMGISSLGPDPACVVPSAELRFFQGAALPELLPPLGQAGARTTPAR